MNRRSRDIATGVVGLTVGAGLMLLALPSQGASAGVAKQARPGSQRFLCESGSDALLDLRGSLVEDASGSTELRVTYANRRVPAALLANEVGLYRDTGEETSLAAPGALAGTVVSLPDTRETAAPALTLPRLADGYYVALVSATALWDDDEQETNVLRLYLHVSGGVTRQVSAAHYYENSQANLAHWTAP